MNLVQLILDKVKEEDQHEEQIYSPNVFRASQIGGCPRAIQYGILGYKSERFTPETLLIFKDGHLHEAAVKDLLNKVVTVSHNGKDVSKQYKHKGHRFTITGHIDCVIRNGEAMVIDVKSMSMFSFKYLNKDFEEKFSNYVDQVTIYMDITGIKKGGLLIKNKNDGELVLKSFDYDPKRMESILDRIIQIREGVKRKKLLERPYKNSDYKCKSCLFRMPCRKLPMEGKRWPVQSVREGAKDSSGDELKAKLRESIKAGRKPRRKEIRG